MMTIQNLKETQVDAKKDFKEEMKKINSDRKYYDEQLSKNKKEMKNLTDDYKKVTKTLIDEKRVEFKKDIMTRTQVAHLKVKVVGEELKT